MRPLALPLRTALSALLVFCLAIAGCGTGAISLGGSASSRSRVTLIMRAQIHAAGFSAQSVVRPLTAADVAHVVFRVYSLAGGAEAPVLDVNGNQVQTDVPAQSLDQPIVLGNLPPESEFRVRAYAYSAAGTATGSEIGDDSTSYADVQVGNDSTLAGGLIPVYLRNTPFAGAAPASLNLSPGGVIHAGGPSGMEVELAVAATESGEIAPSTTFALAIDPSGEQLELIQDPGLLVSAIAEGQDTVVSLVGIVVGSDGIHAAAFVYHVSTPYGDADFKTVLPWPNRLVAAQVADSRGLFSGAQFSAMAGALGGPNVQAAGLTVQDVGEPNPVPTFDFSNLPHQAGLTDQFKAVANNGGDLAPGSALGQVNCEVYVQLLQEGPLAYWEAVVAGSAGTGFLKFAGGKIKGLAFGEAAEYAGEALEGLQEFGPIVASLGAGAVFIGFAAHNVIEVREQLAHDQELCAPSPTGVPAEIVQTDIGGEAPLGEAGIRVSGILTRGEAGYVNPSYNWVYVPATALGTYTFSANISSNPDGTWDGEYSLSGPSGSGQITLDASPSYSFRPDDPPQYEPLNPRICGSWGCIVASVYGTPEYIATGNPLPYYSETVKFDLVPVQQ